MPIVDRPCGPRELIFGRQTVTLLNSRRAGEHLRALRSRSSREMLPVLVRVTLELGVNAESEGVKRSALHAADEFAP